MPRILVVEDDPDLLFLYETALAQAGFEVVGAENASMAMSELDYDIFDIIMLDLNMPDAHGSTVIDHLRCDNRHDTMPILVVTANDHWLGGILNKGVDQVLVKPVSMKQVVEQARRLTQG